MEILGKQHFPKNLKLADVTPVYKKKDPGLVENFLVKYFLVLLESLKEFRNTFQVLLMKIYLHIYVAIDKA